MDQVTPFVISEFTNPSGNVVFPVYARLDGERFRKDFMTRAEAEPERQVQIIQFLQRETGSRAAATRLNDERLRSDALLAAVAKSSAGVDLDAEPKEKLRTESKAARAARHPRRSRAKSGVQARA
jgi:hypothetical protein